MVYHNCNIGVSSKSKIYIYTYNTNKVVIRIISNKSGPTGPSES